jgi:hypothetical protein
MILVTLTDLQFHVGCEVTAVRANDDVVAPRYQSTK